MQNGDKITILINKFCLKAGISFSDFETYLEGLDYDNLYNIADPETGKVILKVLKTQLYGIEFFLPKEP